MAEPQVKDFNKTKYIDLANPMSEHFATFIYANSIVRERMNHPTVMKGTGKGQTVVICGAGPSLREHAKKYTKARYKTVWGCNSAMPWLLENGHRCTHGFCIDQTPEMMEEWETTPDVEYLLASTVHPHLTDLIAKNGRRIRWFHNYTGMENPPEWEEDQKELLKGWEEAHGRKMTPEKAKEFLETRYEDFLYHFLYPPTVRVGHGLNSVNRAVCLAEFMQFSRIVVLGADCALAEDGAFHCDGAGATMSGTPIVMEGKVDGRLWKTKPDMVISAVMLVMMKWRMKDRLVLVGDTFPNALVDKTPEFLNALPKLSEQDYNFDDCGERT